MISLFGIQGVPSILNSNSFICGASNREAVSTIVKVFGMTRPRGDQNPRPPELYYYTIESVYYKQGQNYNYAFLFVKCVSSPGMNLIVYFVQCTCLSIIFSLYIFLLLSTYIFNGNFGRKKNNICTISIFLFPSLSISLAISI